MRVLISQRVVLGPHGDRRDALEHSYVRFFESLGIQVIPVPAGTSRLDDYFSLPVDGVVLTGGNDVDGRRYGAATSADASVERDETEAALVRAAIDRRWPVLGICRGMQFLNVFFGGRLIDLTAHVAWPAHQPGREHDVVAVAGADRELGQARFAVNSYHRQAVTAGTLAPELETLLVDPDSDVIEGLFHPNLRIAAVQFHPERYDEPRAVDLALVSAFRDGRWLWRTRA
jgi:putative glutamine amidotransferase